MGGGKKGVMVGPSSCYATLQGAVLWGIRKTYPFYYIFFVDFSDK